MNTRPYKHRATFLIAVLFALSIPAFAADVDGIVNELIAPLVEEGRIVGCSVGVIHEENVCFYGFGRDPVPDEHTVYEIASITKLFTGVLFADMIRKEEIAASAPLAPLLPPGTGLPQKGDRPITLLDIATHRSGLPRLPPHFWEIADTTPGNPYKAFTAEKLFELLALWQPEVEPQERYEYSNYGFAILGNVLADKVGIPYEELLRQRVLLPLGMEETQVELTDELAARLAPPHDAEQKLSTNWDLAAFVPGGGLRSTVADMVRFAAAALGLKTLIQKLNTDHVTDPAQLDFLLADFELAQKAEVAALPGRKIGLAWNYHPDGDFYWHTGLTGGYFSMLLIDRTHGNAVVILSNSTDNFPDSLAVKILHKLR